MIGVTTAAAAGIGLRSLLRDLGSDRHLRVWTDSTAFIGICSRQGIGKIRHLDTRLMWIQQRIRNNDLDLYKILGEENPADILTKATIPKDRMEILITRLGCTFESGRPVTAPLLRQEGGKKLFHITPKAGTACRRWADEDETEGITRADHEKVLGPHRGIRVVPPNAPAEVPEQPDALMEHGLRMGSAQGGRAPLQRPSEGAR